MNSDIPLDYAVFQLSPRRSRCDLFVSYDGTTEKLASGLVKPFVTHLKAAEELVASAVKSIKLEVKRCKSSESWFTKGTLERFVHFVSTPDVLELVYTFDTEMSQLEAAQKIYSQGPGEGSSGDGGATTASDVTKKELLRAIDVRLIAVGQDLYTACAHASAAGFNADTILELQHFAEQFGAHRLSESCSKFMSLCQRRPELFNTCKSKCNDQAVRSSSGSDMSLDDQANDSQTGSLLNQHQPCQTENADELKYANLQTANKPSATHFLHSTSSIESSIEKEDMKESSDRNKEKKEDPSSATADSESPIAHGPLARRLSVQDRINLFETKQKENSSSGSGSKPAVGKYAELRRLSADVSSAGQMGFEKAVMRRWSGASDMSIDISGERKEVDSSVGTLTIAPTKTSSSSIVSEDKDTNGNHCRLENQPNSKKEDFVGKPVQKKLGAQLTVSSAASHEASTESKSASFPERSESDEWKHQTNFVTQSNKSFRRSEDYSSENLITTLALHRKVEQFSSRAHTSSEEKAFMSSSAEEFPAARQDCVVQKANLGVASTKFGYDLSDCETYQDRAEPEDVGSRNQDVPRSHFRTFKRTGSPESAVSKSKGSELDQAIAPPNWRSLGGGDEVVRTDYESGEKQADKSSVELEDSGADRHKFQRHGSASSHAKKPRGRRDDSGLRMPRVAGKTISDNQETFSSTSATSMEQDQKLVQSRGNQDINDELKLKANELEKLFAEHKLRVPGNQSSATERSKSVEKHKQEASFVCKASSAVVSTPQVASTKMLPEPSHSDNAKKFSTSPLIQPLENQDFDDTPKPNIHSLGISAESRGKLYNKYMQKRDAKLKEDWSSKGAEKLARMKAIKDSLERSKSEMKTKLAGSANRQDSRHRAEQLRLFSAWSATRQQQPIHSFMRDDDEDQTELGQGSLTSETYLADSSSRSVQSKKGSLNNNSLSSTPRIGAPVQRPSAKASSSSAGRRKLSTENPLAQSVPNFSDFRRENTKPSSASSKVAGHSLVRNYSRSKSSSDDVRAFEEKSQQPQQLRKSSANLLGFKDFPSLNIEGVEHSTEARPFFRKGNAFGVPSSKSSFAANVLVNGGAAKEEEDLESVAYEDYDNMDNYNQRGRHESVKSGNSGHENGDALGVPSEANPASIAEMPAELSSAFRSAVSVLDSPGEGPGSWHSHIHNPYSFQHDILDFDASVVSPVGSPAHWNPNDSDAARMRKKWGAAQKPIVVSDSSHGQSRKDVNKGLKRFLKFGRKNRGADSLVDWVSATTSEGDDDTEDGKDPANRSSEDLRKSRMGFSEQVHGFTSSIPAPPMNFKLSENHLSGSALKAPKSFFSLSTFRSKGSDSKLR